MQRTRPPAQAQMLNLITGYWISEMILAAAKLGVADVLAERAMAPAAIAKRLGAQPDVLKRLLRSLSSVGMFAEQADGKFRLTPLGQTLRSNQPGSLRDFALMILGDHIFQAWRELGHGLSSGDSPFEHVHGMRIGEFLRLHPAREREFAASMASLSATENPAIVAAYPFGKFSKLVDVGGAHGHLLASLLKRYRKLKGILFDVPTVVAAADHSPFLNDPLLRTRCDLLGGDFFSAVPPDADAYLMKYIVHDWPDNEAIQLLRNCREAMSKDGRVLVVERVITAGNHTDWAKLLDINMFVVAKGAQERTRKEYEQLFKRAGLRSKALIKTKCPLSIMEAVRA